MARPRTSRSPTPTRGSSCLWMASSAGAAPSRSARVNTSAGGRTPRGGTPAARRIRSVDRAARVGLVDAQGCAAGRDVRDLQLDLARALVAHDTRVGVAFDERLARGGLRSRAVAVIPAERAPHDDHDRRAWMAMPAR